MEFTDGNDTVDGGDGSDRLAINTTSSNATITTDAGTGITTITFSNGTVVTVSHVEVIDFTDTDINL
jgi:hypothetical protein